MGFVVDIGMAADGAVDEIPAASLAEERVTLEDMRICFWTQRRQTFPERTKIICMEF